MSAEILGRVAPQGAPLPFFGCCVSAGFPSPADDYAEAWLSLDELVGIRAPSTYLVRARGDSMIGRGIYDGDVLVVDRALDPLPADVVIACVRGDFTVKELTYEAGQPVLMPANALHQPIRLRDGEELEVWGVVTHNLHALRRR